MRPKRQRELNRLADRTLGNMLRAYEHGQTEAAYEALLFCVEHEMTAPAWALEAWAAVQGTEHDRKKRRPQEHGWVRMLRIWAVEKSAKQKRYGRGREGDKYVRAARLLKNMDPRVFFGLPVVAGAWQVKKSYLRFKRSGKLGYIPLSFWKVFAARALEVEIRRQKRVLSA